MKETLEVVTKIPFLVDCRKENCEYRGDYLRCYFYPDSKICKFRYCGLTGQERFRRKYPDYEYKKWEQKK